jgi:hypothetical protein
MRFDSFCQIIIHFWCGGKFFDRGFPDRIDGAKMTQQGFAAGWANPRDGIQLGGQPQLRAAFTVCRDSKPMRFIAHPLY